MKPGSAPTAAALTLLRKRHRALLEADLANVRDGVYPAELLFQLPYRHYARVAPRLAADLPRVVGRMKRGDFRDLPTSVDLQQYPAYYRRTFHWQSDGYLSRRSARMYDLGVEVLFGGTADVMRRQIIPPIVAGARTQRGTMRILDVGCGTARGLSQLMSALPEGQYDAIDLSRWYLQEAAQHVGGGATLTTGNAESLPWPDATFDTTFSVYLFHELPRATRRKVWREMLRVTRPGGSVVIMDSLQCADTPEMSGFADRFDAEMHEPFFADYQRDDLARGLAEVGLTIEDERTHFLSKLVVASRPSK